MFDSLEEAIHFLMEDVNASTNMRGNVKVSLAITKISSVAMEEGMSANDLQRLVRIILNTDVKLAQKCRTDLIKCLLPRESLSDKLVVDIIFYISRSMFTNPGPSTVEVLLLSWVLLVFDYIDSHSNLQKLYNVIFLFIQQPKLLPGACHLLFLLTRESDVQLFRVQEIMKLMERVGNDAGLIGLLTSYKVFKPHLVPVRLDCSHKLFFKSHNQKWKSSVDQMMSRSIHQGKRPLEESDRTVGSRSHRNIGPTGTSLSKRRKMLIPEVHSAAKEIEEVQDIPELPEACGSIPYQHVESLTAFLESLDKIEYPSQIASCLQEPKLLLLMSCCPDKVITTRLCLWMQHFLVFGFQGSSVDGSERSAALLRLLVKFSQTVKSLPLVHGFLENFLLTWDGLTHAPLILELVSCINPCSFKVLWESILKPLSQLFFKSDVYFKCMYVSGMIKLIESWTLHLQSSSQTQTDTSPQSNNNQQEVTSPANNTTNPRSSKELEEAQVRSCVHHLVKTLDSHFVVGLRMEDDHLLLQQAVLDFLSLIASTNLSCKVPLVFFPRLTIQRLMLSEYAITVARLCGVVTAFRELFVSMVTSIIRRPLQKADTLSTNANDISASESLAGITLGSPQTDISVLENSKSEFNALLVDMVGMLWQGSLRVYRKKYAYKSLFSFQLPATLEEQFKPNQLTIYMSPAFLTLAYKFLKETQREGKKLRPEMIKDLPDHYLEFLTRENLPQIKMFVDTNLKSRKAGVRR